MALFSHNLKTQFVLFFLVMLCLGGSVYGQVAGDYRSVASGSWSTLSTWQFCTTTGTWDAGTPAAYPGQNAVASRVFINDNTTVTADVSIFLGNRPSRLEFTPNANNAVLNINPGVSLGINGPVVLTSPGTGSNTGDAILNVGSGTLEVAGILSLNNTQGSNNDCILRIGTSGTVNALGTETRMLGAADENAIIFDGAGTLNVASNTVSLSGGSLSSGLGTINFSGAAQTVGAYSFNNVILSGSGTKTISATTTIAGSLTISGAVANLNIGTTYAINSFILGTNGQIAGTWGSTSSTAANTNNTYFAGTSGKLNVGLSTPDVTVTPIGTYNYTGLSQGPTVATNTGTGSSYTFSYRNNGGTAYGPTPTPPTNAGNYFVTATVAANGSWATRSSAAIAFVINKGNLTITASNDSKLVGLTYLVGANSTAFSSFGLQNGETIGTITTASAGAPGGVAVGTYPIIPSAAAGGTFSAANYNIGYTNGTLTVSDANTGDYRSIVSGVWTNVNTWESWNGTAWVTPPATYPSQTTGTGVVYIRDGHEVSSGSIFVSDANRASRIELSSGTAASSLTIDGTSTLGASGGIRIRPSTLAGVTRTINIGNGRLNAGNILIENTGNDGIDSEIIIGSGTLYVGNGNVAMGGSSLRNTIRFMGAGTLQLDGNSGSISGGTIVAGTGRVSFSDSAAQVVGGYAFYNLTLMDGGIKTINAAATIAGNLTISGSAKAQLPTGANIPVNSLILGSNGKLLGTWGSTTASPTPTYNDDIHFNTNATAGILIVAKSTSDVIVTVGTYIYTGVAHGPNTATNVPGTGASYTYSYAGVSPTVYGPSATRPTIVGTYAVTATVAADGNFVVRSSEVTPFSIAKRDLTITGNTTTILRGDTYATIGSTDFTASGLQNSETIGSVTMGNSSGGVIGIYPTFLSAATGGTFSASNYTISYANGSLTVNPHIGDYWTKASGNWNALSSWERWNGTAWVIPTGPEGYPGQFSSPDVVYIQSIHNIIGNVAIGDPNFRLKDLIFLSGAGDSSLTISAGNPIQVNNQVRMLSGGNRAINVGSGFFSAGSIVMSDTGSDSIDSKITVSTGAIFCSGNLNMQGSAARNVVEFTGAGSLNFIIGTATMTGGGLIPATGTVAYSSNANQVVGVYDYYNLTLTTPALHMVTCIKTVPEFVTISNHFAVDYAASASLQASTTYNVTSQSLGCRDSEDGTWGSTTSPSVRKDDIYFQPTTGLISVAVDTSLKTPVTSDTQPSCAMAVTTGTITVTKQYDTDLYSFDNGLTYQTSNIKTGLAPGTYNIYIKNSKFSTRNCTSPVQTVTIVSATRNWNGSVSTDWNTAANWTPAIVPTSDNCVVIGYSAPWRNPSTTGNAVAFSLIVKDGAYTIVDSGHTLKITDKVTVNAGTSVLFFRNNASLLQINDVENSGNIQYRRTTPSLIETDYTYWSSPVEGQSLSISSDYASGRFYFYDYSANDWSALSSADIMAPGKGYIIRGQKNNSNAYTINATFTGKPNNGDVNTSIGVAQTANLIGNPYPSAIDADDFIAANSTRIEGTIYFWTHKTAIQNRNNIIGNDEFGNPKAGSGLYAYTSDDYASYNATGGVEAISGSLVPNGNIAAAQGFFVNSLANGTVTFTNTMRRDASGNAYDNSQFFKTKNQKIKKETALEKHRIWLNLSNKQGAFKQTLVGYIATATNEYDSRFDGESFDGNDFVDFYSINSDKNLVIQGRALPFNQIDEVPLGYRTAIHGEFSIKIDQVDGLFGHQEVFLEDKLTNSIINLKNSSYTFTTAAGKFDNRFVLRFKDKTLGIKELQNDSNLVRISIKDKQIKINSNTDSIEQVIVYDLLGRNIYQKDNIDKNELILSDFSSSHQGLIVKTKLQNGKIVSNKIIY